MDYLEKQREEVIDMMLTLFDQETLMRNHDASLERKSKAEDVMNLMETLNLDPEKAMDALQINEEERTVIRKIVENKMQIVFA